MNRTAAVARDIAVLFNDLAIDPLSITPKEFDDLPNAGIRSMKVRILFLTWSRAMKIVKNRMDLLASRAPAPRSPAARREAAKKKLADG